VDVTENEVVRSQYFAATDERMRQMFASLPRGLQNRFTELLKQCNDLRSISQGYHAANSDTEDGTVSFVTILAQLRRWKNYGSVLRRH